MKARALAVIFVLACTLPAHTQVADSDSPEASLPPISWTCPMHPEVVEDQKGSCHICKMDLVPVRLVSVWTCPVHAVIDQDHSGKCKICGRDLIQTTKSLSFTCNGHPEISVLQPGQCADNTPRMAKYSARPHGDHNPRHGGYFFMAPDNWHHVEGAYPSARRFRVYLYDDYTRPLPLVDARKVRGRVVTKEMFDNATRTSRELASAPLTLVASGMFLEGRIEPLALPAKMTVKLSFGPDDKESRFDFTFPAFSQDVVAPLSTSQAAPPSQAASPTQAAPPSQAAPPVPTPTDSTMTSQAAPQAIGVAPRTTIDANSSTAQLIKDLRARDAELGEEVKAGAFGAIYVPALAAKDIALEIQTREAALPAAKKATLETHVKALVVAAYDLDNYGDLGDAKLITGAYQNFTAAVSAINSLLSARP